MPAASLGCDWYSGFQKWFLAWFSEAKNATFSISRDCTKASENATVTFEPSGSLAYLSKSNGAKVGRPAAENPRISTLASSLAKAKHGKALAFQHGVSIVVAEAEERRRRREVVSGQFFWAIDFEQLDEIPRTELGEPIRRAHSIFVGRSWRQSEAEVLIDYGGAIQVLNRQHNMVDGSSARHSLRIPIVYRGEATSADRLSCRLR